MTTAVGPDSPRGMISRHLRSSLSVLAVAAALAGCQAQDPEAAGRAAAERAKAAIKSADAEALAQKLDPAVIKQVQEQLTSLKEYMGPVNGRLDAVTVNAIVAFQRAHDLTPDGMLDKATLARLADATR